ncbi:hypothetical protein V3Q77_08360 [Flavobacterium davisii]|uniref:Major capsid protein n=1 Tax=Flavobacterium davisii TaxID=2906077 RepID=A0ABW8PPJ2_9FLAO
MNINTTNLVTAFGDFYLNEGQNMDRLKSAIRQPAVTPSYAVPIVTESDVYRTANTKLVQIVQQFQKQFTAKGDITFEPNEIRLRNIKIDLSLYPDDVKGKWLGFLSSLTDQERANWPIVRYLLEKEVVPQIPHDMESLAYWGGSYVAPTAGTAGHPGQVLDGLKKLIDAGLTANTMKPIALSAVPNTANIFEMIEEFASNVLASNAALSGVKMRIYMSPSWLRAYFRDKRNTHGTDVNYSITGIQIVDFMPNIELVALPSMEGSNYIWATPVDNFVHLRKVNGMATPRVEESKREVFLMLDWWEGLGFLHNELVFVYKQ